MPAAQRGSPGKRASANRSAAPKSSFSPWPSSKVPALRPTPRKLKRSTATPMRVTAFAAW